MGKTHFDGLVRTQCLAMRRGPSQPRPDYYQKKRQKLLHVSDTWTDCDVLRKLTLHILSDPENTLIKFAWKFGFMFEVKMMMSILEIETISFNIVDEIYFCSAISIFCLSSFVDHFMILLIIYGKLSLVQRIYLVKPSMDLHTQNDVFFCTACECGHLEIAKWLLSIKPDIDIRADNDYSFKKACENKHAMMVVWLVSLFPTIYSYNLERGYEGNTTIQYRIRYIPLDYEAVPRDISQEKITSCSICYNEKPEIITMCDHQFCKECIYEWMNRECTCPYCRHELSRHDIFAITIVS